MTKISKRIVSEYYQELIMPKVMLKTIAFFYWLERKQNRRRQKVQVYIIHKYFYSYLLISNISKFSALF